MRVVPVNPADPREDRLAEALGALVAGQVIALPTETFYGLAVDAMNREALGGLNRLKGKPDDTPILLLVADRAQVGQVAAGTDGRFDALAERFWPGPLTLVVPAAPDLAAEVSAGSGTVAVRMPGLALPRRLAAGLGRPITGVSANRSGEPPGRRAGEVARTFDDRIEMILDGGPTAGGAASTILSLCGPRPTILRHGLVPRSALEPLVPDLADTP